jgi:hypothetical protein
VMDPRFIPSDNPWQKAFTMILVKGRPIWTHLLPYCHVTAGYAAL